jgi:hypothetical protein
MKIRIHELGEDEDIIEGLTKLVEADTGKEVFTMRVLGEKTITLEIVVVFKDKSILFGEISTGYIKGRLACRLKGNWI